MEKNILSGQGEGIIEKTEKGLAKEKREKKGTGRQCLKKIGDGWKDK